MNLLQEAFSVVPPRSMREQFLYSGGMVVSGFHCKIRRSIERGLTSGDVCKEQGVMEILDLGPWVGAGCRALDLAVTLLCLVQVVGKVQECVYGVCCGHWSLGKEVLFGCVQVAYLVWCVFFVVASPDHYNYLYAGFLESNVSFLSQLLPQGSKILELKTSSSRSSSSDLARTSTLEGGCSLSETVKRAISFSMVVSKATKYLPRTNALFGCSSEILGQVSGSNGSEIVMHMASFFHQEKIV